MAIKIAELLMSLNPLYWIFSGISLFIPAHPEVLKFLTIALGGAAWGIISFTLAELSSKERGYFIVWYLLFFFGGIVTVIWFYTADFLVRRKTMVMIRSQKMVKTIETTADRVAETFEVYTPKRLKEYEIQDYVNEHKYDEAIWRANVKLNFYLNRQKNSEVKKYQSLIKWLEHMKHVYKEEEIINQNRDQQ
jgi:hypothetical protein